MAQVQGSHTSPTRTEADVSFSQSALQDPAVTAIPLPVILAQPSSSAPQLIAQGAEALLYKTTYLLPTIPCALKYRPPKPYRHPILDARLTRHRILSEARVLTRCRREGVLVPAVYSLDEVRGWLMLEWVNGEVVRIRLNEWLRRKESALCGVDARTDEGLLRLMERVGRAVGRMHGVGVVHGDLTTSNLMLRPRRQIGANEASFAERDMERMLDGEIVLIDFGLASQSVQDEDRAVDLYVLERAFGSTHPGAESFFSVVLRAYGESFNGAKIVLKKLEEVRMRGRKRSMLG